MTPDKKLQRALQLPGISRSVTRYSMPSAAIWYEDFNNVAWQYVKHTSYRDSDIFMNSWPYQVVLSVTRTIRSSYLPDHGMLHVR